MPRSTSWTCWWRRPYRKEKREVLVRANLRLERLRWLLRLARERNLLTARQQEFIAEQFLECGKMLGGWIKASTA